MKILAFESSAKAASVALMDDQMLIGEYTQNSGQTHSRTLMQMAEDLLKNCDLCVEDLDVVAVAAGPGSFTGVRIGVAAAKGLAWGRQIPCVGVSTLKAMVMGAATCDGVYCACMDARRSQVYHALFRVAQGKMEQLKEDCAISLEELGGLLKNVGKTVFVVGDGAHVCYNTLKEEVPGLKLLPEHLLHQRASGVALAALEEIRQGSLPSGLDLTPNYLRLSQAERERMKRLNAEEQT